MIEKLKLLIIDDDQSDHMLMQRAMKQAGFEFEITTVFTGEEGMQKVEMLKPHIIILDCSMPGMDGFEVCRKIKEFDSHLKIVICTGVVDTYILSKAKISGADACCFKTPDYKDLMKTLEKLTAS